MLKIIQVDAFTAEKFCGNPAAVCFLNRRADEKWMQAVAREMNLSETAFVRPLEDGYELRWFTPEVEVDLCGHATLATSHVLWEEGILKTDEEARYHTRSGLLTAMKKADWIELDFPAAPPKEIEPPDFIVRGLGVNPVYLGKNDFDYLVLLQSEKEVRDVDPDFPLLASATPRGTMVTSLSDSAEFDFVSRFFAPGMGIDEDPVTGSAHCCLGPFWQERLGKSEFVAFQASARGGVVRVTLKDDRVGLGGQAVTIWRGELL